MILLDTNVVVYALNRDAPEHRASRRVVEASLDGRLPGVLVPQVVTEAFAILTDRRRVAKPLDPEAAWKEMEALRRGCRMLPLVPEVLDRMGELLQDTRGQDVFDVLLAAQALHHGVDRLCTYNTDDFRAYEALESLTPSRVRVPRRGGGGRRG